MVWNFGLGGLYFGERRWDLAQTAYTTTTAVAATETRYQVAATEVSRQAELVGVSDLFSELAFCLARLGKPKEAIEHLEAGRARGLAEVLARDRAALEGVKAEDQADFEAVRNRIKSLEAENRAIGAMSDYHRTTLRSFTEISDDLRGAQSRPGLSD